MTRPGFSFLACPDSELIRRRIRSMLDGQGLERRVYWGDEDLPPQFWQDMSSQGLFGGCKAVVVRHAQALPEKTLAQLSPLLAGMNESAWPIFCVEVPFEKGGPKIPAALKKQKYWIFAEKKGWVWTSPGLTEKTLPDYLRAWSKDTGIAVPQPVLRDLAAMLPPDAAAVDSELAKLELALAGRRELRAEDLGLVAFETTIDFFSLLDALLRGRLETRVLREVLRERSSSDGLLFKLLANMARDARLMWMILSGENTGLPGWMTQKKEPLARAAGPARVAALFGLLMEAEHGVKSGERTEAQALENLVAELSRLFTPARRGA